MLRGLGLLFLGAALVAADEVHNDVTYQARFGPDAAVETAPIKASYESTAAKQADERLRDALTSSGLAPDCLSVASDPQPQGLYALKDCIVEKLGEDGFFTLLADDIDEANDFWSNVVSKSTADHKEWVPARAWVKAFFGGKLTATEFAVWTQSKNADDANLHANPEHYYKATQVTGLTSQSSQIFEGWGGVLSSFGTKRTNFTVPEYTTPNFGTEATPDEWSIGSDFGILFQRIGPKILASGDESTFGYLHIAVRDVAAHDDDNDQGVAGIEVYSAVWYPPWDQGTEEERKEFQDNYLADEAHHMVVEVINLTHQAYLDCKVLGILTCVL